MTQWSTTGPSIFHKGSSSGYSHSLVRIEQILGWNGYDALLVVGYFDSNRIRINGGDTGNNNYMGLTTNAEVKRFNINGGWKNEN